MLDALRRTFQQRGYLSGMIIDESERLPSSSPYHSRLGSLLRAYHPVGFRPDRDYRYVEVGMRRFSVPCPRCGARNVLSFSAS
jgi:hypothetical protein